MIDFMQDIILFYINTIFIIKNIKSANSATTVHYTY